MLDAARRFDESQGFKFSTYASSRIYFQCLSAISKAEGGKKLPIVSIDELIMDDSNVSILDMIADDNAVNENRITNAIYIKSTSDKLTDDERLILNSLLNGKTITQIKKEIKLSQVKFQRAVNNIQDALKELG